MRTATKVFVGFIVCSALVAGGLLYLQDPTATDAEMRAILLLAALAVMAETLAFLLPRTARGSIAFIPYLATIVLVPSWASIVAVSLVKAVMELIGRVSPIKALA